jgi:archaellum component FlaD/FlaE
MESLGISVPEDKELRKEAYNLVEYCRAKRELQIASKEWGYIDNSKTRLIDYMREIGKTRAQTHRVNLCVKKLEKYDDGDLPLQAVSEQWLLNFQKYLLRECGINATTAAEYYQVVKQALNQAARERLIQSSPAGNVKSLSTPER